MIQAREPGVEYSIEHHQRWFVILTNNRALDFRLMLAPAGQPERDHWLEVVPHRPGTRLEDVDVFDRWLVLSERLDGEPRLRVIPLGPPDHPFDGDLLERSWLVPSAEHPAVTWEGANPEPSATTLRYEQTSMVTPRTVLDGDLATGESTVRKQQPVLGGYDPDRYRTYRLWAEAADGARCRCPSSTGPTWPSPPPACSMATGPTSTQWIRPSPPYGSRCSTEGWSSPSPT